jgi:hypothetical protein
MRKSLALLALFCLAATASAGGSRFAGYSPFEGQHASSCMQWMQARKDKTSHDAEQFLLGYVTGIAAATGSIVLKDVPPDGVFAWMDNFCASNPIKTVLLGGDAMVEGRKPAAQ